MHTPMHEDMLPDHIRPMAMPDTRAEARLLLLCLEAGYFPSYKAVPAETPPEPDSAVEAEMLGKAA